MTIKEVEERTGLARSNIRFYEKEGLIKPLRKEGNGYRDYTEEDVEEIKKIACLRTVGITIEDIRRLSKKETNLHEVLEKQKKLLEEQLSGLQNAKRMCEDLLTCEKLEYENLNVENYISDLEGCWNENKSVFKLDSVSFIYLWGGTMVWGSLTLASLLIAAASVCYLPARIPVQWSDGAASSLVDRRFILLYPAACILIRFLLRPGIDRWLKRNAVHSESLTNYVTNYLCFLAVSVEVFTILFVNGIVKNVIVVLLADTAVLLGVLLAGWRKLSKKREKAR